MDPKHYLRNPWVAADVVQFDAVVRIALYHAEDKIPGFCGCSGSLLEYNLLRQE